MPRFHPCAAILVLLAKCSAGDPAQEWTLPPPPAAVVCANLSTRLPAAECAAWQGLLRQLPAEGGPTPCSPQDPCQCAHVVCGEKGDATHIEKIWADYPYMHGDGLPDLRPLSHLREFRSKAGNVTAGARIAAEQQLSGAPPPLGHLPPSLEFLDLRGNNLTGPLPDYTQLGALTTLMLGNNPGLGGRPLTPMGFGRLRDHCDLSNIPFACPLPPGAAEHCHARCGDTPPPSVPQPPRAATRNVLLLIADDLRPELSLAYGQHQAITPNLDAFARTALIFDRAYCQFAVCSPSRSSFMSGLRKRHGDRWHLACIPPKMPAISLLTGPDSTKVFNFLDDFRQANTSTVSMPQHFKQAGFVTLGQGKTFHNEMPPRWDQPFSWTEPGAVDGLSTEYCGVPDCYSLPVIACNATRDHPFMGFVCGNELPMEEWGDYKGARFAVDRLRSLASPALRSRRFFYAVQRHPS